MKIALICALPDLANSGMLSVDLAFESLKKYLRPDVDIIRFCSWKNISRPGAVSIHYQPLTDVSQLEQFDKIIYWGDFLHWHNYGPSFMSAKGTEWYAAQHDLTIDHAKIHLTDAWYSMYLLENRIDLQKKSIIFGGTICGINSDQISVARYQQALHSLYQNAQLVLMRDYLSACYVSQIISTRQFAYGCDCALFLEDFFDEINIPVTEPYMVYSFGRCKTDFDLEKFALDLAAKNNVKPVKIQWLHPKTSPNELQKNLDLIRHAQFAVTDIYHFAVSTWREKIPTLTIGRGNSYASQGTLNDKKKELFNSQILAMNYYLFLEDVISGIAENRENYLKKCHAKIQNKITLHVVDQQIQTQIDYARNLLVRTINGGN